MYKRKVMLSKLCSSHKYLTISAIVIQKCVIYNDKMCPFCFCQPFSSQFLYETKIFHNQQQNHLLYFHGTHILLYNSNFVSIHKLLLQLMSASACAPPTRPAYQFTKVNKHLGHVPNQT